MRNPHTHLFEWNGKVREEKKTNEETWKTKHKI